MITHPRLDATGKPYKIFAEAVEDAAIVQFADYMEQSWVVRGALMPDCHTGYSLPIGAVIACDGVVSPQAVGYDIGCGVCALPTSFDVNAVRANAKLIFDRIRRDIPLGFNHNKVGTEWPGGAVFTRTAMMQAIFIKNGLRQLGSLGGGNHFIEVGRDEAERVWIIIHSGSRGIGHAAATYYMKLASGDGRAREGHFGFSTDSAEGKAYITDLNFCLAFALRNRTEMVRRVELAITRYCAGGGSYPELINRNHNHAELRDGLWIHRKGATHAEAGMMGVVPGNMLDGSFIVRGKGNPEALWSSSHGAGRVMGRKVASRTLSMEDFRTKMAGVVATVTEATLDESPGAYKDIYDVMRLQQDLVEVVAHVRPILNVKG